MRQIKNKVKVAVIAVSAFVVASSAVAFKAAHRFNGSLYCGQTPDRCTVKEFTEINPTQTLFCASESKPNGPCIATEVSHDF